MGDTQSQVDLIANADGTVSYQFEGKILAQGLDLQAAASDINPSATALIRWLDANGNDAVDLMGAAPVAGLAELFARSSAGRVMLIDGQGKSDLPIVLYRDPLFASAGGDLAEDALYGSPLANAPTKRVIPANRLGKNRIARLKLRCSYANNAGVAVTSTIRCYLGGVLVVPAVAVNFNNLGAGVRRFFDIELEVGNEGTIIGGGGGGTQNQYARTRYTIGTVAIGAAPAAGDQTVYDGAAYMTLDTTQDVNVLVTQQLSSANATIGTIVELATLTIE